MKKNSNILLSILIVLAIVGGGLYLQKIGKLQLGKLFERQLQTKVEEQMQATSTEKLSEEVVESLNEDKTELIAGTEGVEEQSSESVSVVSSVVPQRQLSTAEIQQQINEIKLKIDLLTIEVRIYNIQQEAKKLQLAETQQKINDIAEKIENLTQQISQFAAENPVSAQVAGVTNELPFTGGPIQDIP